ncbi:MAG TPA: potassium transporter TrkG, partial [Vicinamibacteria bacterium]
GARGVSPVAWGALATGALGGALRATLPRPEKELNQREALLLVVLSWFAISACGALPFLWSGHFPSLTDAFFESASGFTTTGATVLARVEVLAEPVQLWRHLTHWIGGMGIVLLGLAVLPVVGHGGMALYRAEFSGAKSEKLKPRIAETAMALWKLYLAFTVAQTFALRAAGMTWMEAVCHTFSTLGTGGFSTRTASVGGFASPAAEWIVTAFMLLAGMSFVQHYRLLVERRPRSFFSDFEVRAYLVVFLAAAALVTLTLVLHEGLAPGRAIRAAAFQVASIQTTTGFATEDFERWFPLAQAILLGLMFVGGCTGSTAGGVKIARVVLLARVVGREFKRMVERHGVFAIRLGGRVTPEETIQSLLSLIYLSLLVLAVSALLLTAMGVDILTSIAAVVACMFNIGPGLGTVGPAENYGHLPALAKWVLCVCMIAGRLEFYTLLVLLTPGFWRK